MILEKTGINKILKDIFGNKTDLIKALANYYLSDGNNTIQGFKYWLFKNYAGLEKSTQNLIFLIFWIIN
ncbi:hypothetical protein NW733_02175 [Mycoplasmopsis felis]|uniref:hypothetical protein n=1 Tax=Mycoplasmopsis felis TaxID=33923 RepID=UPI0021E06422|nr:hypothetical protein [Mycoplasmopsis felis]MCU9931521.1 hypothetical protein [Mycoplasmopsis felis]